MSQQTSPRDVRAALSGALLQGKRTARGGWARGCGPSIAVGAVVVLSIVIWVNAMVTPVTRDGHPTSTVAPLPAPTTATPTVSATPSTSGSPTPSAEHLADSRRCRR